MKDTKRTKPFYDPITVIVAMRNSATTILYTLESIEKQDYPIKEIIVIDNISTDSSIEVTKRYAKKSNLPIHIIKMDVNRGVGASYNRGAKESKTELIVFMHSDSSLLTPYELKKLTQPLRDSQRVVASYPSVLMPQEVWEKFNFWEKCLFSRSVGKKSPGMNGKFDCINRNVFLSIDGFNIETFGDDPTIGGEDADLYLRLQQKGEIVLSSAEVVHLHYLGKSYALKSWIANRKLLARTYGRLARTQGSSLPLSTHGFGLNIPLGFLLFSIKPLIAILPFIPALNTIGIIILSLYCVLNSKKMYMTKSTVSNPKILALPFIELFLLYYESFWMVESFLINKSKV